MGWDGMGWDGMGWDGWDGITTHARAYEDEYLNKHTGTSNKDGITTARTRHHDSKDNITTARNENTESHAKDLDGIICILYGAGQRCKGRTERTEEKMQIQKTTFIFSKKKGSLVTPKGIKPHHHVKVIPRCGKYK